jgi:hypothetical protein
VIRTVLMLLLLQPFALQAQAFSLEQLMERFAGVGERSARFVEVQHLSMLDIPLESHGRLTFRAPDYLAKRVDEGGGSYRVEGDQLYIEQGGKERSIALQSYPLLRAFVASFRATLSGDLDSLQRYYMVELEGGPVAWLLRLEPQHADMARLVREIRISGSQDRVERIEMIEQGGDRSVMQLREGDAD